MTTPQSEEKEEKRRKKKKKKEKKISYIDITLTEVYM